MEKEHVTANGDVVTGNGTGTLLVDAGSNEHAGETLVYPMSFTQQRLWFLNELEPNKSVYNVAEALRLDGTLNVEALEESIQEIIQRHESLRTRFDEVDGDPMQIVAPSLRAPFSTLDLRAVAAEARESVAFQHASDEAARLFDLKRGPTVRFVLMRLLDDQHVLLLVMHHIISEGGWSMGVFLRELNALYNSRLQGRPSPLPDLPIQFGDYAIWQREWMQGEVRDQLLDFWKKHLEGAPAVLDLPSDRPRPSQQSYNGAKESHLMPPSLKTLLGDFSRREGATMFMTLFAGLQAMLARYSRQEDLVAGMAVAGRGSPETHDLIGFFTNTLAVRTDLSGDPSFRELTHRLRATCLSAYEHEDLPFEMLVQALKPERSMAYSAIFQVMFSYQNAPREELSLTGLKVSPFSVEARTSMFDLTLFAWERPDGVLLTMEYGTDLFDRNTIQRMLRHLERLLHGAMDNPGTPISQLPLLAPSERQQILVDWNATKAEYPAVSLQTLFEKQVEATPEALAVTCNQQSLTYGELNARANQLASHLRSVGVGPNTLVGVCVDRSLDLIVALLAVVKTGGAYLPLDPNYPDERIAVIVQDSRIGILIAERELQNRLKDFQGQIVALDRAVLNKYGAENYAVAVTGDDLAYVIYTSGSTGRPKGVAVPRKALSNFLWSMRAELDFTRADVLLGVTTISFDIAGLEVWLPLVTGARLVLADASTTMDGIKLQSELERHGVTLLQATPSTWRLLLESGWPGGPILKALCGGESMPADLALQLQPLVGRLWNMYGPTETTIWSTCFLMPAPDHPILIGRPIYNTQIFILDDKLAPVPVGVPGELYIGGDGLAASYLHQPQLTAERFIPNPFSTETGSRIYKTGDLARYWRDGNIECLGRNDHQIKLRGFRIEPEEIRAVLTRHPSVKDAIAVLHTGADRESRLIGYVVPEGAARPETSQLRDFIRQALPEYMVPSVFVFLDALPLTPNGKVNRNGLPAPGQWSNAPEDQYVAPHDSIERQLVEIWEEVLAVHPIGVTHNFFDLGGHSMLLARLLFQVERGFAKKLSMASVFQKPTIAQLADLLRDENATHQPCRVIPIQPSGSRPPFICLGAGPYFLPLARHLGGDQPLLGVDLTQLDVDRLPAPVHLRDIGAYVAQAIREFQPHGPYYLGGWCLYGVLMYEAAQQIIAEGGEVALLTIIDSPNLAHTAGLPFLVRRQVALQKLVYHLQTLGKSRGAEIPAFLLQKTGELRNKIVRFKERLVYKRAIQNADGPLDMDMNPVFYIACTEYQPQPYPGRVALFQAIERPSGVNWDLQHVWQKLIRGPFESYDIAGGHDGMFKEPFVRVLGARMKNSLEQAQELHGPIAVPSGR